MVQISFCQNGTGKLIKQWPNWSGVVPQQGDLVVLHFGDDNEEKEDYQVELRVIDGTRPDYVKLFVQRLPD